MFKGYLVSIRVAVACATAAIIVMPATAQPAPSFEVESQSMPIGAGLPDQKPVEILGLHTGMGGDAALHVLQEHYKGQPRNKLNVGMGQLRFANKPYFAIGRNMNGGLPPPFDDLAAALSSQASGNQVQLVARQTAYAPGGELNTAQTIASITGKYGSPSTTKDNGPQSTTLIYGYKQGKVLQNTQYACVALNGIYAIGNLNSAGGGSWDQIMFQAAQANLGNSFSEEGLHCSAYMSVELSYAYQNGQYNKQAVSGISFVFFDADRYVFAHNRDAKAQAELIEKARLAAPQGTGGPKL
jgi:hypothetical protein